MNNFFKRILTRSHEPSSSVRCVFDSVKDSATPISMDYGGMADALIFRFTFNDSDSEVASLGYGSYTSSSNLSWMSKRDCKWLFRALCEWKRKQEAKDK